MKKLILWILPLALIFTFVSQAKALDYETAYMVKGFGSHTLSLDSFGEYSYADKEIPWVYLKLKLEDLALTSPLHLHFVWSSQTFPELTETKIEKLSLAGLGEDLEIWRQAAQPWWTDNGKPGRWQVDVNWFNLHGTDGVSSAIFDACGGVGGGPAQFRLANCRNVPVVPEPVSSTLFLLGGVPLAVRAWQKKMRSS